MFRHLGELCSNISHYKRVLSMNQFCIVLHGLCVLTAAVFRLDEVQLFHVNVVGRAEQGRHTISIQSAYDLFTSMQFCSHSTKLFLKL